jgi:hypothetical protein
MIEGDFKELGPRSVNNIINKGGTFLKSARSLEFRTPEGRKKAYDNLVKEGAAISILHKHMWPYSSEVGTGREIPQRKNTATSMLSVKPGSKPGQLSLTRLL